MGTIRADFDAKLLSSAGEGCLGRNVPLCQCSANLPLLQQTKPPGFKAEAEVTPG